MHAVLTRKLARRLARKLICSVLDAHLGVCVCGGSSVPVA